MSSDTKDIRNKLRVLAVDDNNLMLKLVSDSLDRLELGKIYSTNSPQEALDELQEKVDTAEHYHILFLDWKMPIIDGLQILQSCRKDNRFDNMAIVMLTAENENKKIMESVVAGATYYIVKPASLNDMSEALTNVIQWFQDRHIEIV